MSIARLIDFIKENRDHMLVPPSLDTVLEQLQKAKDGDKKSSREWSARGNYTDDQSKAMREFIEQGYSPREAERFADAHSDKTMNYDKALKGSTDPSVPSEKHRAELQELAKHWLSHADKYDRAHSDKESNPVKYAAGKMEQAQEAATGGYKSAYNEFLSSDDVKGKSGRERHSAIRNWKKQYREENPDYEEGLDNLAGTQKEYEDAHQASTHNLQEKIDHITRGGQGGAEPESEPEADEMSATDEAFQDAQSGGPTQSAQAASQLAGGASGGGEGAAPTTSMIKPEEVSFAEKHEKLMGMLSQEQKDRHSRIGSAKQAQEQQQPEVPKKEFKPAVVRRRRPGGE